MRAMGAVVALLACAALTAQNPQAVRGGPGVSQAAKLYRIAGTVTNSVTGEAVSAATLTVYAGEPRHEVQTILTDAEGHFELNPLPAAKYSLRASRRGYLTSNFDQHEQYSSAIVTGEGQDTEHIPFHLSPGATIRGVVTDDAGEPVENANVLLMRKTKNGGLGEHLVKAISGVTDDAGLFEYWDLAPGTYFLAVKATPWYALHPLASEMSGGLSEEQRNAMAVLDVAYPVTYYGSVTDEAAATPITIKSGERVEANMSLHAVPAVHLTMHIDEKTIEVEREAARLGVITHVEYRGMGSRMLEQSIFGDQNFPTVTAAQPGPPGSGLLELAGIAPGHYSVMDGDPPRLTEFDATGDQVADLSSGAPTFSVDVKVKMADGSAPPQGMRLLLLSDGAIPKAIFTPMGIPPDLHFVAVPPGRWNMMAQGSGQLLTVASIQSGAEAKADSRIVVKDHGLTVTAVVEVDKTNLAGFAKKNGKGEAGVMVVLVPRDPAARLNEFRRDQSDSDGSFLLRNVAPGDYTAVAIEDGWELEWARPEVISRYLHDGTPVTVTTSSGSEMQLSAPVAVQPH